MAHDHRRLHEIDDAELSELLHSLAPEDWEAPSLCDGWRVRDVVGHILYGNELKLWTLPWKLGRFGFSSDRSGRHYSIARADGRSPERLLADFDSRDPWAGTPRIFGAKLTYIDRFAHQQDIRRPLDRPRAIPEDRLVAALEPTPRLGSVFGAKRRTRGLRLVATDAEWRWGDGPEVTGPGEALFMAMLGRRAALADLGGEGLAQLEARFP